MPDWCPDNRWAGQDAYVIGGGTSLTGFDWSLLRGRNTVGCNSAFILGPAVCQVVVFGDYRWWTEIGRDGRGDYTHPNAEWQELGRAGCAAFGGEVVACLEANRLRKEEAGNTWLLHAPRHPRRGLGTDALGWHGNTGSLATNYALAQGARRVYLLGFDMELGAGGRGNWHDLRYEPAKAQPVQRFRRDFRYVADDLPKTFPGCEVVQVTDCTGLVRTDNRGDVVLENGRPVDLFPRQSIAEHFRQAVAA